MRDVGPVDQEYIYHDVFYDIVDYQLSSPQVQALIKSNPKFDLVVSEKLFFPAYYGLVHHVGSPPVVSVISFGGKSVHHSTIGNPSNPSYIPDVLTYTSDHMNFWERLYNTYVNVKLHYIWHYYILPRQEVLLRKHFGSAPPPVAVSDFNDSLLILCNHWSLGYPKPMLPNVLEVTGLHVETKRKPLPKDIKSFFDGAKHGVVYFSLGSNVRSENLPKEIVQQILQAFSEIPQRVLWKWEADTLPGLPANVMLKKWLPQQDILAHPNIRVFITQGGLQSFQEAAYHGVPLIAIPFMADQPYNAAKYIAAKIGVKLEVKDLTKGNLLEAIGKVVNDSSYRDNMKKFSAVFREEMEPSLDRAIWWIEYVLRHNGARHLRSAALDLAWYQYLLLDVIAFVAVAVLAAALVSYLIVKKIFSFIKSYFSSPKLKKN
ncbi:UDP-glucosyltransferase 2 isoform X2 [Anabrus simplex]